MSPRSRAKEDPTRLQTGVSGTARGEVGRRRDGSGGQVKSADRILAIFEYLAAHRDASFGSIAADLDLPNSSAYQLLQTALRKGFLELDPESRRYLIGIRLWEVAQAYPIAATLVALAQPLMDDLADRTMETVQLARLDGLENVYLAIAESPHPMKLVSKVGGRLPAHATGLGKALLAGLSDDELASRLKGVHLGSFTDKTISDRNQLVAEISRVRASGFSEDNEEYIIGCRCVAAPVHDRSSRTIAAMSVSVPTPRYSEEVARSTRTALLDTVRQLEKQIAG